MLSNSPDGAGTVHGGADARPDVVEVALVLVLLLTPHHISVWITIRFCFHQVERERRELKEKEIWRSECSKVFEWTSLPKCSLHTFLLTLRPRCINSLPLPVRCGQPPWSRPSLCSCALGSVHSRSCQCRKWFSSPSLGWQLQARRLGLHVWSGSLQDDKRKTLNNTQRETTICFRWEEVLCQCSPGSMSSKLDLASGCRNSDFGVNTISWRQRDKERAQQKFSDLNHLILCVESPSLPSVTLRHLQASWRAAGSAGGGRGSSLRDWSSWQRSSYSRTADALRSLLTVSDKTWRDETEQKRKKNNAFVFLYECFWHKLTGKTSGSSLHICRNLSGRADECSGPWEEEETKEKQPLSSLQHHDIMIR